MTKTINQFTEDTSPATGDFLAEWDVSAAASRKVSILNVLKKLVGMSDSSFAFVSWTPTWTNVSVGNATQGSVYLQLGKIVYYKLYFVWGSTTSMSGSATFTLPVTSLALVGTGEPMGRFRGTGPTQTWQGVVIPNNTTSAILRWFQVSGTGIKESNLAAASPESWTTGNVWWAQGFYEAA